MASLALLALLALASAQTPLDDYVNMPDDTYTWSLVKTENLDSYTYYVINMTSQTWMTSAESDRSVWWHWLQIIVPAELDLSMGNVAMMYINGGDNTDAIPSQPDPVVALFATAAKCIAVELNMIPNQPINFFYPGGESGGKSEDGMIAYTWAHFLNDTSDPIWLARLPMVKASVRALDTITAFVATLKISGLGTVNSFYVAGGSKRGWTTWDLAAVDKRIAAIAPIVAPVLNLVQNINHQWEAYGEFTFAFSDYTTAGIMRYLNDPRMMLLCSVVDPFAYIYRLTMPKYIICTCGDEFFLPDDVSFFFNSLQGETHFRIVPNAEHTCTGHVTDLVTSVATFFRNVAMNKTRPQFTWNIDPTNGTITLDSSKSPVQPTEVKMWHARTISGTKRDFRLLTPEFQPVFWFDEELNSTTGIYIASRPTPPPQGGWEGFMVELTFTSEVSIIPNYMPFPSCGNNCQPADVAINVPWNVPISDPVDG